MSQNIITRQGSCRLLNYYSELLNEPFTASLKRFTFFCLHSHLLITVLLNVTSVRGFWDFTCSWLHAQLIANKLSWPFEFSPAFFIHCSPSRCLTTSRWTQRFLTFSCSVFSSLHTGIVYAAHFALGRYLMLHTYGIRFLSLKASALNKCVRSYRS